MTIFGDAAVDALLTGLAYMIAFAGIWLAINVQHAFDLTVGGSFTLGGAISAVLIAEGHNPWLTLIAACLIGAAAGGVTFMLYHALKLPVILASIITNTAILSIGLRIMGKPEVSIFQQGSIFTDAEAWFGGFLSSQGASVMLLGLICAVIFAAVGGLLYSQLGLAFRMAGVNPTMARANGVSPKVMLLLALLVGNALSGLSGALIAQSQGFADVHMGDPILIVGLTGILIGELFVRGRASAPVFGLIAVVLGSYVYRYLLALALRQGVDPQLFNLLTAVIIVAAITINLLVTQASARARTRRLARQGISPMPIRDAGEQTNEPIPSGVEKRA